MKKQHWLWVAAIAATVITGVVSFSLTHSSAGSTGILYHVEGGQSDMYLLGSIHVGNKAMYPFGTAIRQAMQGADTFVYECDTTSEDVVSALKARMALPEGETLQALIGDDLYNELSQVCDSLSLPLETLNAQKPWAVINTLAVYSTAAELNTKDINTAISLGVEKQVQAYAAANGKQTAYLETAQAQTDILEGFSDSLKRYLLQSECDTILHPDTAAGLDAGIADWPTWWQAGDADAFAEQYLGSYLAAGYEAECTEYHQKLITDRNATMAAELDALLQDGGSYFVTVGLLHLVLPEDSIVSHLTQLGYTVTRVETAD